MYKTGGIAFDINANRTNGRTTNIQFMTQDTGGAKLSFSFTKDGTPLPLSAVDAKIVLLYADGSFYKKSLTITDKMNGKAEYVLSDEELKHYGTVKAEIKLYYTNGQALATSLFTFSIAKTLEDQNIIPTADYYIDDFETLKDGINHTVEEISRTVEELQKKFADLEAIETKEGAQRKG
nr:phage baseplate upper protein [Bacillus velezensis]